MTKKIQQKPELIVQIQIDSFRLLMAFASVSEKEFSTWFETPNDIRTLSRLRKDQVTSAMCRLFEKGAENHRLQGKVVNHG